MTRLERRGAIVGGVIGWLASIYVGISVGGRRQFLLTWVIAVVVGSYLGLRVTTMIEGRLDDARSVRLVELDDGVV